jgi:nucleoside-diphosphate-sugar epimerase
MFLVMGITGKVGGATAEHLLAHGKEVRALVRNREKAANWANRGVELVDGDWNDSEPSSKRSKASKARSSCCRPSGRPRPITKKQRA